MNKLIFRGFPLCSFCPETCLAAEYKRTETSLFLFKFVCPLGFRRAKRPFGAGRETAEFSNVPLFPAQFLFSVTYLSREQDEAERHAAVLMKAPLAG